MMRIHARIRKWLHKWMIARAVRRLNANAAFFGFAPLTATQWLRGCRRIQRVSRLCGVTLQEATAAFTALGEAARRT